MNLTILGCYGPYPPGGGCCSGYLLEEKGVKLLIDCGNGVLSRLQEHSSIWDLAAVLLSHLHSDHTGDLMIMRYALEYAVKRGLAGGPLPLYSPGQPVDEYERLSYKDVYAVNRLEEGQTVRIGPYHIALQETVHAVPCLAMRIETESGVLVYSGDTEEYPGLTLFARGAGLFICEANYQEEDMAAAPPNHLSAAQAARIAAAAGVKKLLLTHLSAEKNPLVSLNEAKEHFGNVELAREGITYTI